MKILLIWSIYYYEKLKIKIMIKIMKNWIQENRFTMKKIIDKIRRIDNTLKRINLTTFIKIRNQNE